MTDPASLDTTGRDVVAAALRGAAGAIPFAGGLVAEIVNSVIPKQKLERVADFARLLGEEVARLRADQASVEARLRTSEGSDLFEEGLVQASRALSDDRRRRIAHIVASGLTDETIQYDRTRKLLAILSSLTDSEILMLYYFSRTPTIGSPWHRDLMAKHPELLRPVSREIGGPKSERERGAIKDAYERSLIGHGLLEKGQHGLRITSLGELLLAQAGEVAREDAP